MTPEQISLYGPIAVMLIAAVWAGARILYLGTKQNVSVLSFMARKKTLPEKGLGLIAIILDGYLFLRPFISDLDQWAYAFGFAFPITGITVMALGIALILVCQMTMGLSWRIGVPREKEKSQTLVRSGLYRYSRNPIYLGIMIFIIGAAITVPGPITIGAVIATAFLLQPLIKREEAFLTEAFGEDFQSYCQEVRRWI